MSRRTAHPRLSDSLRFAASSPCPLDARAALWLAFVAEVVLIVTHIAYLLV